MFLSHLRIIFLIFCVTFIFLASISPCRIILAKSVTPTALRIKLTSKILEPPEGNIQSATELTSNIHQLKRTAWISSDAYLSQLINSPILTRSLIYLFYVPMEFLFTRSGLAIIYESAHCAAANKKNIPCIFTYGNQFIDSTRSPRPLSVYEVYARYLIEWSGFVGSPNPVSIEDYSSIQDISLPDSGKIRASIEGSGFNTTQGYSASMYQSWIALDSLSIFDTFEYGMNKMVLPGYIAWENSRDYPSEIRGSASKYVQALQFQGYTTDLDSLQTASLITTALSGGFINSIYATLKYLYAGQSLVRPLGFHYKNYSLHLPEFNLYLNKTNVSIDIQTYISAQYDSNLLRRLVLLFGFEAPYQGDPSAPNEASISTLLSFGTYSYPIDISTSLYFNSNPGYYMRFNVALPLFQNVFSLILGGSFGNKQTYAQDRDYLSSAQYFWGGVQLRI